MVGGLDCFTVKFALQEATPLRLPSLRLAVIWYEPGRSPRCQSGWNGYRRILLPYRTHAYFTVCLGWKLEPLAVAVTGSPAKTSVGCTEQAEWVAPRARRPPNMNTRPVWSLTPCKSVVGVVAEGPNR